MLESWLENMAGDVVLIVRSALDVSIPAQHQERATVVPLRNLIYGLPVFRLLDVIRFSRIMLTCSRLHIVGADLMDGLYNPSNSIARSSCLRTAAGFGKESRVIGFSWSDLAHPSAVKAQIGAGPRVQRMARDPISAERLRVDGIPNVIAVADTVFALTAQEPYGPFDDWLGRLDIDRGIAMVNMSALIGGRISQTEEYRRIVHRLVLRGYSVVMVPHVLRLSGNDNTEIDKLDPKSIDPRVLVIEELLTPGQIRYMTSHADITVSGRMHLSVMSLSTGAIPVTLGTQGKVEGLYRLFSIGGFTVVPKVGFGSIVELLIDEIDSNRDELKERLHKEISCVRELSANNFRESGIVANAASDSRHG
jgi:polysaccharide pyruvyl transferase WcaK-like protein